jgi:hypothetical protein
MILNNNPINQGPQDRAFMNIRRKVAGVLIEQAGDGSGERRQLTRNTIATMLNTGSDKVHLSLKSLNEVGAIKIDRNRIIVKLDMLQQIAGAPVNAE